MLAYEEALALIRKHVKPLPAASLPLIEASGAFLARELKARLDMPTFDNAAMDGVGVRLADVVRASARQPVELKLVSECRAGDRRPGRLRVGEAVRIFTGAPLPAGVDAVVMQEHCEFLGGAVRLRQPAGPRENIRSRGEEYAKGTVLFGKRSRLTPAMISVLASQGYAAIPVFQRPRVAVVGSGDELCAPGTRLPPGGVYDANSPGLQAALAESGLEASVIRVADNLRDARRGLAAALKSHDVVLVAGGISVGDYDIIRTALTKLNVRQVYWRLAVKPGKPNYFGIYRRARASNRAAHRSYVFGLPGNPVAVLVGYLKLVKPALAVLMGSDWQPRRGTARLTTAIRKPPERLEWMRAALADGRDGLRVTPRPAQESHMLGGLASADCLIDFPAGRAELKAGTIVGFEYIEWGL